MLNFVHTRGGLSKLQKS